MKIGFLTTLILVIAAASVGYFWDDIYMKVGGFFRSEKIVHQEPRLRTQQDKPMPGHDGSGTLKDPVGYVGNRLLGFFGEPATDKIQEDLDKVMLSVYNRLDEACKKGLPREGDGYKIPEKSDDYQQTTGALKALDKIVEGYKETAKK